jgi:ParB family chromosome partitioning protein
MSKQPNRLGKGLGALIGQRQPLVTIGTADAPSEPPMNAAAADSSASHRMIDVSHIAPNPNQPRKAFDDASLAELADSIRANGVIQPILVRPKSGGIYELVAGERRLRAAILADLKAIPAIVRNISDQESIELAIVENIQREDLGPLERAAAYEQYIQLFKCPVDHLAQRLGESRANITNYLRLLKLPAEIREAIQRGDLGMGQARAIVGMTDPRQQLALAQLAIRRNLSVRQVEAYAKDESFAKNQRETAPHPQKRQSSNVEHSLSRVIGLPVRVVLGKKKNSGRVIIEFNSLEEFDRISERLAGSAHLD